MCFKITAVFIDKVRIKRHSFSFLYITILKFASRYLCYNYVTIAVFNITTVKNKKKPNNSSTRTE